MYSYGGLELDSDMQRELTECQRRRPSLALALLCAQTFLSAAQAHGFQTCVQQLERSEWDRPGLRGTCDYEGGYNWVYLQWQAAPAAEALGVQDLPWTPV